MSTEPPEPETEMSSGAFIESCRSFILARGLATAPEIRSIRILTGGVSSNIALVDLTDRRICVKRALSTLRVAARWSAPTGRNASECSWLKLAERIVPGSVPKILADAPEQNLFAMQFVDAGDHGLWKTRLLAGHKPIGEGAAVGSMLGKLHAGFRLIDVGSLPLGSTEDFDALRLEPYFLYTATRHPAVAATLNAIVDSLRSNRTTIIHGDVSPKNILITDHGPVLIDAECATWSDPAFDVAFCVTHLALKALHIPSQRQAYLEELKTFFSAYCSHVDWEDRAALERRTCRLVAAMLLARVDGKSPVEYLSDHERLMVRQEALAMLANQPTSVTELTNLWGK